MTNPPNNNLDIIDSRNVIARIEELQEEGAKVFNEETAEEIEQETEEQAELKGLTDLQEEASSSPDWPYGEALIRDSYFKRYAQEFAKDTGALDGPRHWPNNCIDWDQATDELQMDYTSVDFSGVTYWIRS